ncbi:MAG: EAL domain-containing protein [Agarilytica sp.]
MNRFSGRWSSVQSKILRTILISFLVGITVAGVILLVVVNNIARSNMIDGLNVTAKIIADRSAASLIFLDSESAKGNLVSAKNRQNIDFLCLYDADGYIFSAYMVADKQQECEQKVTPVSSTDLIDLDSHIAVYVPVIAQSELLGHLYIKANTRSLSKNQWVLSSILSLSLVVSLIVAYVLGRKLVKRLLLPLDVLYKTSSIIADSPLSDERAEKISDDEFGRLVDVFNAMLDNLASENKALIFSEKRFRTLSESAPIGVFLKNDVGEYEYTNARWNEITGLDDASAASYTSFIERSDRVNYKESIDKAIKRNKAEVIEYHFQNPLSGNRVLMEYVSPVEDEAGRSCFIGSLLDVTELKVAQFELEKLAFYDPLTQLPNRRFFRDHLGLAIVRAQKENKKIAMYMTDLDDFKKVNDSLGHDVGDDLLIDIAHRLKDTLHEGDVVSRMGGDEFMILLDNIEDPTRLDHASQRLIEALQTSASSGNQSVQVSGSIGIAIYPTDANTPETLMRYADMALYNAKGAGGNRVSYYSGELDRKIKEKVRIEQKLRKALEDKKLDVYIQPQYVAGTRDIFWGEALVRWIDDDDGFIPPDLFIPLAEETGLIYEVGDFVFERVLRLLSESGDKLRSISGDKLRSIGIGGISVNLSAKQFFAPNFSEVIGGKFKTFGVAPSLVEFELTESMVMDDIDQAITVMGELRELGCQLSIDDFGTGYSSLAYLKRFPITSLKIDKSFIQDIPADQSDVEISCAIIALAHSLGMSVVAEGVETDVQARLLASYECEFLQGYFFDRPMPISDLLSRVGMGKKQQRL